MGILNPKPRFGLDTDTGLIYDYIDKRDVPVTASYHGADGHWDLTKVRDAISLGNPIETAKLDSVKRPVAPVRGAATPAQRAAAAKPAAATVAAAGTPSVVHHPATAPAEPEEGSTGTAGTTSSPATSKDIVMTSKAITDLGLSEGQLAALGIKPQQAKVSGLTGTEKAHIKMTPARAKVLKLSAEQEAAFS